MKLNLSTESSDYMFSTRMPVRVNDLVGGVHVANHILVAYCTDAQMQFMAELGFPKLIIDGAMPVNSHLQVSYLSEAKYGDSIDIDLAIDVIDEAQYQVIFNLSNATSGKTICQARMAMAFIDLSKQKRGKVPQAFIAAYHDFSQ